MMYNRIVMKGIVCEKANHSLIVGLAALAGGGAGTRAGISACHIWQWDRTTTTTLRGLYNE